MVLAYPTAVRNAWLDAIVAAVGTNGVVRIYQGTRPATGGATGTLLATLTVAGTFGAVSAGVLTVGAVTGDTAADVTGTAQWFRVSTSGGTMVIDGDVGTSGSDMNVNTTAFVAGAAVNITSFTITAPNA